MGKFIDLTNQKFDKLFVLGRKLPNTSSKAARWLCQCDCGNMIIVSGVNLRSGHTKSCGCINKGLKISEQNLLDDLDKVYKIHSYLTIDLYKKYGQFNIKTINRRFGSWNKALRKANLPINHTNQISNKSILNDIKNCIQIVGKNSFNSLVYDELGSYCSVTVAKHFGSWSNAMSLVGIRSKNHNVSDQYLLESLYKTYIKLGYPPTNKDVKAPCERTYYLRFPNKTWSEILLMAGIPEEEIVIRRGLDSHLYDSHLEMLFANKLFRNLIDYEPHKRVCDDRLWRCDFYIPIQPGIHSPLWLEYDGLENRRKSDGRFEEKLNFYKKNNYNIIIITPNDDFLAKCNLYIKFNTLTRGTCELSKIAKLFNILQINNIPWSKEYNTRLLVDKIVGIQINNSWHCIERVIYEQGG